MKQVYRGPSLGQWLVIGIFYAILIVGGGASVVIVLMWIAQRTAGS